MNVTHHRAASVALNKLDKQPLMNPGAASILHWFCCNVAQLTFGIQQKSYYFRVMRYSNNIQNTKMPDLDQRFKVCHKLDQCKHGAGGLLLLNKGKDIFIVFIPFLS